MSSSSGASSNSSGPSSSPSSAAVPFNSYLTWAVLATIFCFLPTGIVAIVKAASASSFMAADKPDAARKMAADAKKWSIITAVVGLTIGIVYAILRATGSIKGLR